MMRVVIRADASTALGAGHVMRCLALADGLRAVDAAVTFVCRKWPGHLQSTITARGFSCELLPGEDSPESADARQTAQTLAGRMADWLIVDHYGTSAVWDRAVRSSARRLLVIDDLADRARDCDLLLNQNDSEATAVYGQLVPTGCRVLAGPRYALLRAEFSNLRRVLDRRATAPVRCMLVSLGGVDSSNLTAHVLDALRSAVLPAGVAVVVLLGRTAPWIENVRALIPTLPWPVDLQVDVAEMARLLRRADLAIGAAGSSAWERCAAGLPSVAIVAAGNQAAPARTLTREGAAAVLEASEIDTRLAPTVSALAADPGARARMSGAALALVDGSGVARVVEEMQRAA